MEDMVVTLSRKLAVKTFYAQTYCNLGLVQFIYYFRNNHSCYNFSEEKDVHPGSEQHGPAAGQGLC
jgi:hypothetical protein